MAGKCICGKQLSTGDIDGKCQECRNEEAVSAPVLHGWICPVCGRGNAPFNPSCPCLGYPRYTVTAGGS